MPKRWHLNFRAQKIQMFLPHNVKWVFQSWANPNRVMVFWARPKDVTTTDPKAKPINEAQIMIVIHEGFKFKKDEGPINTKVIVKIMLLTMERIPGFEMRSQIWKENAITWLGVLEILMLLEILEIFDPRDTYSIVEYSNFEIPETSEILEIPNTRDGDTRYPRYVLELLDTLGTRHARYMRYSICSIYLKFSKFSRNSIVDILKILENTW